MERFQIENLYKANGLEDFRLRDTEDLWKTHGINVKAVDGYSRLDDVNRHLYEKFIVNIFNAFGLESRDTLVPKGIYYVEDVQYLAKENNEDDYYIVVGGIVSSIDKNGMKSVLHSWKDEKLLIGGFEWKENDNYLHLEATESESKKYLRFEYEHRGHKEWLHVTNENSWY